MTTSTMPSAPDARDGGLLAWQWAHYRGGHVDRTNLAIHAISNPLFLIGSILPVLAIAGGWWLAPIGLALMIVAIAAQGRGHRREPTAPIPFRGAGDVVARLFVEQWVTFPRFVLSGGFAQAWRGMAPPVRA